MKAIVIEAFGGPEVLCVADISMPEPGAGQVLVRVAFAGVNFADTLMRQDGYVASYVLPAVPGSEIAGIVERCGPGVEGLVPGQRVAALMAASRRLTGGYAEFAVAESWTVVPVPDGLPLKAAAAVLVQGLTALLLTRHADLVGRSVLVTAAAGGVGSLLVQMLGRLGAGEIVACASSEKGRAVAIALGASRAIGYEQIASASVDLALVSSGGDVFGNALLALKPGGGLIAYGAPLLNGVSLSPGHMRKLILSNITCKGFALGSSISPNQLGPDLRVLFEMVATAQIKVDITPISLAEASRAHRDLDERRATGKAVLVVGDEQPLSHPPAMQSASAANQREA